MVKNMDRTTYDDKHFVFGLLFVLGNRLQAIGDGFYDEITCKQWFVLIGISLFANEPPTINEIADAIGSSHQNIKQIVNKLENAGFVKMYTDEKDRRKIRVKQTQKCIELEKKYKTKETEFLNALYENIDQDELRITKESLEKIEKNVLKLKGKVK
jgi:DNA-binding MarR family transcriptional regulator